MGNTDITLVDVSLIASLVLIIIASIIILRIRSRLRINSMQLKSLLEVDHRMMSGLSHQGIMHAIHDKLVETIHPDGSAIIIKNQSGTDRIIAYNLSKDIKSFFINSENGIIHAICEHGKLFELRNIEADESEDFLRKLRSEGYHAFLGTPIITKGGIPAGIVSLLNRRSRVYSKNEKAFINGIASQLGLALDRARLIDRIQEMHVESVKALVKAIEARDEYTEGHSIQVADLAIKVAQSMDMSEREIRLIEFAGLLHDVGKIVVPENILKKPSALTCDEWAIIKRHTIYSSNIIEPIKNLHQIRKWILYHHERWDGDGYPEGIKANSVPLQARILSVCDTFSAMTEDRPYRKALDIVFALDEIKKVAGSQLDPDIVRIFVNLEQFTKIMHS